MMHGRVPFASAFALALALALSTCTTAAGQDANLGVACSVNPRSSPSAEFSSDAAPEVKKKTFVEVSAEDSGLTGLHYVPAVPPRCLLGDWSSRDKVAQGSLCDPEINTAGVAVGDFDGDGSPDLFASALGGDGSKLYRNDGAGRFEDVTEMAGIAAVLAGVSTTGANFADVDADGDLDLYVLCLACKRFYLFINDGAGHFREEALERGAAVSSPFSHIGSSVTAGDYDGDGYLDLHTTAWMQPGRTPYDQLSDRTVFTEMRLLRNLGKEAPGYFEDVTRRLGVGQDPMPSRMWKAVKINGTYSFSSQFVDMDRDGHLDLAVASDFATTQFYWNNGDGTFRESFLESFTGGDQNAMGSAFIDSGDGGLDWFVTGIHDPQQRCRSPERGRYCPIGWRGNYYYRHLGGRKFENRAEALGVQKSGWAWGCSGLDFDNDGDTDIAVANNYLLPGTIIEDDFNSEPNHLFVSDGNGGFEERGAEHGFDHKGQGRGLVTLDADNDGDLDIVVAHYGARPVLFRNDHPRASETHRWLRVLVFDYPPERSPTSPPTSNRGPALNAVVTVVEREGGRVQTQHIGVRSNLFGSSEPHAHFGFGDGEQAGKSTHLHEVNITWHGRSASLSLRGSVPRGVTLHVYPPAGSGDHTSVDTVLPCTVSAATTAGESARDPTLAADDEEIASQRHARVAQSERTARDDAVWRRHIELRERESLTTIDVGDTASVMASSSLVRLAIGVNNPTGSGLGVTKDAGGRPLRDAETGRPLLGAAGARLIRVSPPAYADGIAAPAGPDRPSARLVSNLLCEQGPPRYARAGLNQLFVTYGQFLSHDMDFSTPLFRPAPTANFPIAVPVGDAYFDRDGRGREILRFRRSMYDTATGHAPGSPREQLNQITAVLDASHVYGSHPRTTSYLRDGAHLRLERDGALPRNADGTATDNPTGRDPALLGVAGDSRSNVQPGLSALHTVFALEHNRWAAAMMLAAPAVHGASATGAGAGARTNDDGKGYASSSGQSEGMTAQQGEAGFHAARRVVTAILQHITYDEYLPALLAPRFAARLSRETYRGFNASVDPQVSTEAATAAMRFGHSQVDTDVWRVGADWKEARPSGHVPLRDAYFAPERIVREGGIDAVMRGLLAQPAQEADVHVVDALRNFLFGASKEAGGLDLTSANIQRGRDHGIADYNTVRRAYGLEPRASFDQITSDKARAAVLSELYGGDINNVDLYIAGLAEDPVPHGVDDGTDTVPGVIGETFSEIITEQFVRTRDGDPMFYLSAEAGFSDEEIDEIEAVSLADVIARNTGLSRDQGWGSSKRWTGNVFRATGLSTEETDNNNNNNNKGVGTKGVKTDQVPTTHDDL